MGIAISHTSSSQAVCDSECYLPWLWNSPYPRQCATVIVIFYAGEILLIPGSVWQWLLSSLAVKFSLSQAVWDSDCYLPCWWNSPYPRRCVTVIFIFHSCEILLIPGGVWQWLLSSTLVKFSLSQVVYDSDFIFHGVELLIIQGGVVMTAVTVIVAIHSCAICWHNISLSVVVHWVKSLLGVLLLCLWLNCEQFKSWPLLNTLSAYRILYTVHAYTIKK